MGTEASACASISALLWFFLCLPLWGRGEMKWEKGEVGEEIGERKGKVWRAGNGNAGKIAPKHNIFGIWDAYSGYCLVA